MKQFICCLALALGVSTATPSAALHYSFFVDGFSEGASVSGYFKGTDLNGDGVLTSFAWSDDPGELTEFGMTFSGNSIVPAFSGDGELSGFSYELFDGPVLGDTYVEGIEVVTSDGYVFSAGLGPLGGLFSIAESCCSRDRSDRLPIVSRVPLPAGFPLMLAGLLAFGIVRRRKPF